MGGGGVGGGGTGSGGCGVGGGGFGLGGGGGAGGGGMGVAGSGLGSGGGAGGGGAGGGGAGGGGSAGAGFGGSGAGGSGLVSAVLAAAMGAGASPRRVVGAIPSNSMEIVRSSGGSDGVSWLKPISRASTMLRCSTTDATAPRRKGRLVRVQILRAGSRMRMRADHAQPRPGWRWAAGAGGRRGLAAGRAGARGADGATPVGCSASNATLVKPPWAIVPITSMIRP